MLRKNCGKPFFNKMFWCMLGDKTQQTSYKFLFPKKVNAGFGRRVAEYRVHHSCSTVYQKGGLSVMPDSLFCFSSCLSV